MLFSSCVFIIVNKVVTVETSALVASVPVPTTTSAFPVVGVTELPNKISPATEISLVNVSIVSCLVVISKRSTPSTNKFLANSLVPKFPPYSAS